MPWELYEPPPSCELSLLISLSLTLPAFPRGCDLLNVSLSVERVALSELAYISKLHTFLPTSKNLVFKNRSSKDPTKIARSRAALLRSLGAWSLPAPLGAPETASYNPQASLWANIEYFGTSDHSDFLFLNYSKQTRAWVLYDFWSYEILRLSPFGLEGFVPSFQKRFRKKFSFCILSLYSSIQRAKDC